jgi:FkbM family methyltransferase
MEEEEEERLAELAVLQRREGLVLLELWLSLNLFKNNMIKESVFENILGENREWMIDFIKEFRKSSYEVYTIPNLGKFHLDAINDYIKNFLRSGVPWEPQIKDLMFRYIRPQSTVLDVGAHIGSHTLSMSKRVGPLGRVLAFEPQPKIFRELFLNMILNEINNVLFYPVAVGDRKGSIELSHLVPNNEGATSLIYGGSGLFAPLITIDSLQLDDVSLIKIDVELHENFVLDGAKNTITRCRPILLVEIRGDYAFDCAPQEIKNQILFTISKIKNMGYSIRCIGYADYLAIPEKDA